MYSDTVIRNQTMIVTTCIVGYPEVRVAVAREAKGIALIGQKRCAANGAAGEANADGDMAIGSIGDADATGVDLRRGDGSCGRRAEREHCQSHQGRGEHEQSAIHDESSSVMIWI
jgi:hypothetical protein